MSGLLLSDDLIFTSRIVGTARSLGFVVQSARTADEVEAQARQQAPRCVIVDLANPGLAVPDLIERLRAACTTMPRIVAYGSHVDAAGLRAAREAGCELVLPRSAFVEELPQRLPEWLADHGQ
jgi:CheY-like chemotaxis protein